MDDTQSGFDPRFEDPRKLDEISRRGFLGGVMGVAGAALLATPRATRAAQTTPPPTSSATPQPDDEPYWRWVADQFLIRENLAYMNTGTRGPSPRSVYEAQIEAIRASNVDRLSYARYVH
ncbi:MAG: twin-arginine translocation signal domain-containing protein, partial [Pseudomonadales bacterium]